jgi:hypothetical protein
LAHRRGVGGRGDHVVGALDDQDWGAARTDPVARRRRLAGGALGAAHVRMPAVQPDVGIVAGGEEGGAQGLAVGVRRQRDVEHVGQRLGVLGRRRDLAARRQQDQRRDRIRAARGGGADDAVAERVPYQRRRRVGQRGNDHGDVVGIVPQGHVPHRARAIADAARIDRRGHPAGFGQPRRQIVEVDRAPSQRRHQDDQRTGAAHPDSDAHLAFRIRTDDDALGGVLVVHLGPRKFPGEEIKPFSARMLG